jgi:hypothetical protein
MALGSNALSQAYIHRRRVWFTLCNMQLAHSNGCSAHHLCAKFSGAWLLAAILVVGAAAAAAASHLKNRAADMHRRHLDLAELKTAF